MPICGLRQEGAFFPTGGAREENQYVLFVFVPGLGWGEVGPVGPRARVVVVKKENFVTHRGFVINHQDFPLKKNPPWGWAQTLKDLLLHAFCVG